MASQRCTPRMPSLARPRVSMPGRPVERKQHPKHPHTHTTRVQASPIRVHRRARRLTDAMHADAVSFACVPQEPRSLTPTSSSMAVMWRLPHPRGRAASGRPRVAIGAIECNGGVRACAPCAATAATAAIAAAKRRRQVRRRAADAQNSSGPLCSARERASRALGAVARRPR